MSEYKDEKSSSEVEDDSLMSISLSTRSSGSRVKSIPMSLMDIGGEGEASISTSTVSRPCYTAARVAEEDYYMNGARCRIPSGSFVGPRWVPDIEVNTCTRCHVLFDWKLRRHHCRHCGKIYCETCSSIKAMLPIEFQVRDPQRVCLTCATLIAPLQDSLITTYANHSQPNHVMRHRDLHNYFNLPFAFTLEEEIYKAAHSIRNLDRTTSIRDNQLPLQLIRKARGIAFLTVAKVGMIFAARIGTGLVISRLPNGQWSAPSAIATLGVSWGALIGADLVDYVIILGQEGAVQAFSGKGAAAVGAGVDVALGPVGRAGGADISIGDKGAAGTYTYSQSHGLFAGVSLDGAVILSRPEVNLRFYGRAVDPQQLLNGDMSPPVAAQPLYDSLNSALRPLSIIRNSKQY
mmetsp:Transcript_29106/g.29458  ORF Transcript_29106/g.29458 Transcript_29106/m.29458 type:complete len:405 (+) Transcript_29106:345-1559(+)